MLLHVNYIDHSHHTAEDSCYCLKEAAKTNRHFFGWFLGSDFNTVEHSNIPGYDSLYLTRKNSIDNSLR